MFSLGNGALADNHLAGGAVFCGSHSRFDILHAFSALLRTKNIGLLQKEADGYLIGLVPEA